ncbi:hypothetical protein BCR33DRAFT_850934 [Rhizoclosmatium globosum]|uniref:Endonuclease/exonuclease/phosphatase domain-containing protein n=1 Tax=Rhizoclosmatium globosum TaxID=329046 RepID=A0A1Y2C9M0_9FUNG|nr:hypothetical protein BCR33DRAFT_850934 [Rhizoclosmatium globosum]|eukprot:ORY43732.1 hypothetical protein BCR33DRAFT_850934 [Rhizoclosmatium globosum]
MAASSRAWKTTHAGARTTVGDSFTVMSYNGLADTLLHRHPHLYRHLPHNLLAWAVRVKAIGDEISRFSPDVVCLQEVEPSAFKNDFQKMLEKDYKGIYCRRLGDAVDGCALFYRTDKIKLMHSENLNFKALTQKDNVALLAVLQLRPFKSQTTPPISFSPLISYPCEQLSKNYGHLSTIITGDFNMTEESVMYHYMRTGETEPFLFHENYSSGQNRITANGNPTPYCYPYDILEERKHIRSSGDASKCIPLIRPQAAADQRVLDFCGGSDGLMRHNFKFEDAILGNRHGDTRYYSTCHAAGQQLVDFIFFSPPPTTPSKSDSSSSLASSSSSDTLVSSSPSSTLTVLQYLEPPIIQLDGRNDSDSHHGAKRNHGHRHHGQQAYRKAQNHPKDQMPRRGVPSDHIPLVVEFGFI